MTHPLLLNQNTTHDCGLTQESVSGLRYFLKLRIPAECVLTAKRQKLAFSDDMVDLMIV